MAISGRRDCFTAFAMTRLRSTWLNLMTLPPSEGGRQSLTGWFRYLSTTPTLRATPPMGGIKTSLSAPLQPNQLRSHAPQRAQFTALRARHHYAGNARFSAVN